MIYPYSLHEFCFRLYTIKILDFITKQIIVVITSSWNRYLAYLKPSLCNVLKYSSIRVFDSFFICILWLTSLTSNFQCQYIGTEYMVLLPHELRGLIHVLISNVYMHVSKMYKFLRSRTLGVDREVFLHYSAQFILYEFW